MDCWFYAYAGLRIRSSFQIPEWKQIETTEATPDADLTIDLEAPSQAPEGDPYVPFTCGGDMAECEVRFASIATYRVRAGREVSIRPQPGAAPAKVRACLVGSVWQAVCLQRQRLLLHASAAAFAGGAVLFAGTPGSGKSSMAVASAADGHRLLSDDKCDCSIDAQRIAVYPSPLPSKLWGDAAVSLGFVPEELSPDPFRRGKYHRNAAGDGRGGEAVPVRAICLLAWGELRLSRVTGIAAFQAVARASTYQPQVIDALGRTAWHLEQCAALCNRLPVFELARPRDLNSIKSSVNLVSEAFG